MGFGSAAMTILPLVLILILQPVAVLATESGDRSSAKSSFFFWVSVASAPGAALEAVAPWGAATGEAAPGKAAPLAEAAPVATALTAPALAAAASAEAALAAASLAAAALEEAALAAAALAEAHSWA